MKEALLVGIVLCLCEPIYAQTLSTVVSTSFSGQTSGSDSSTLQIPQFNPSLGSLQDIFVYVDAAITFNNVQYNSWSGIQAALFLDCNIVPGFAFNDYFGDSSLYIEPGLGTSQSGMSLGPVTWQSATWNAVPASASTYQYVFMNSDNLSAVQAMTGMGTFEIPLTVQAFSATQAVVIPSWAYGHVPTLTFDSVTYSGNVSVQYDYTPFVPEPSTLILAIVGILLFCRKLQK